MPRTLVLPHTPISGAGQIPDSRPLTAIHAFKMTNAADGDTNRQDDLISSLYEAEVDFAS
jgi:hypothetical protein